MKGVPCKKWNRLFLNARQVCVQSSDHKIYFGVMVGSNFINSFFSGQIPSATKRRLGHFEPTTAIIDTFRLSHWMSYLRALKVTQVNFLRNMYTLKNEVTSPKSFPTSCQMKWWRWQMTKSFWRIIGRKEDAPLSLSKAIRYSKGGVFIYEPAILQDDILRLYHWKKTFSALRRSKLDF